MARPLEFCLLYFARNIITQDLPEDYYNSFLENINNVTKEDVQNAAQTYFSPNKTRIFITGKGSEILEKIEGIEFNGNKLTVRYFYDYKNYLKNIITPRRDILYSSQIGFRMM